MPVAQPLGHLFARKRARRTTPFSLLDRTCQARDGVGACAPPCVWPSRRQRPTRFRAGAADDRGARGVRRLPCGANSDTRRLRNRSLHSQSRSRPPCSNTRSTIAATTWPRSLAPAASPQSIGAWSFVDVLNLCPPRNPRRVPTKSRICVIRVICGEFKLSRESVPSE